MSVDIETMMKFILKELPELSKNDLSIMSKQEIAKFYQELRQVNGLASTYQQNDMQLNQKKSQENKLYYSSKSTFRSPQYQDSQRKQKKKKKSAKKDYLLKQLDIPTIQTNKFDNKNQINRQNFETRDKRLKQKKQLAELKNNQYKSKTQYQYCKMKSPKQKHIQILAYSQQLIEQNLITQQFDENKPIKLQLNSNKPQPQVLQWIRKLKQTIGLFQHTYLNNFVQQQDSQMQQQ